MAYQTCVFSFRVEIVYDVRVRVAQVRCYLIYGKSVFAGCSAVRDVNQLLEQH